MEHEPLPDRQEEETLEPGHSLDEDGEHDTEQCYECLLKEAVKSTCDCGKCCRHLLIEVLAEDAKREPKIAERGSPILGWPDANGHRELEGYFLNAREDDMACVFLDLATNKCTIYETRPLLCRLFNCDGVGREQLVELGLLQE